MKREGFVTTFATAIVGLFCVQAALAAGPKATLPGASQLPQVNQNQRAAPGVSELTTAECTSLGGVVGADSAECTKKGQFTCKTVTKDAAGGIHVNTACIDEVSTK